MLHCVLIVLLNDHTLSLVPLCLCPRLHFAHFDGCVHSIAPLVVLAFPFVHVCCALCPALCLASLCCMFCLCISACLHLGVSVFLCISIKLCHCALCYCVLTLFCFVLLCPSPALIDTSISRCYWTSMAFPLHHCMHLGGFWCVGFRVLLFFLALKSV